MNSLHSLPHPESILLECPHCSGLTIDIYYVCLIIDIYEPECLLTWLAAIRRWAWTSTHHTTGGLAAASIIHPALVPVLLYHQIILNYGLKVKTDVFSSFVLHLNKTVLLVILMLCATVKLIVCYILVLHLYFFNWTVVHNVDNMVACLSNKINGYIILGYCLSK